MGMAGNPKMILLMVLNLGMLNSLCINIKKLEFSWDYNPMW